MSDTRKTALFQAGGGPISATLINGQANGGAYAIRLWDKNSADPLIDLSGEFKDDPAPVVKLPREANSNSINDGRLLDAIVEVAVLAADGQYSVEFKVEQDGNLLASVSQQGQAAGKSQPLRPQILLKEDAQ